MEFNKRIRIKEPEMGKYLRAILLVPRENAFLVVLFREEKRTGVSRTQIYHIPHIPELISHHILSYYILVC